MPIGVRNLEWLDHNAQRRYPLTGDSSGLDTTGAFTIPQDLIVGFYLPVNFGLSVDPAKFFVSRVTVLSTGVEIEIGYASGGGTVVVAAVLVPAATHTQNSVYSVIGQGDFSDSLGHIIIGSLDGVNLQIAGGFSFVLANSRLEPETIRPTIRSLASLQIQNGSVLSSELSGHVILRAGRNTRFRVTQTSGQPSRIIWDAVDGEGLTEDCVCDAALGAPVRTVSNVSPDGSGNLKLLGNDCLEFDTLTNGLLAKDVCSEPCCGCKELEAVTSALESFGERATTLENFLVSLEARVTQMDQVVLGSRLGDRGCTPAQECP